MESEKLLIDYGSGYSPYNGYKTEDVTGFPNLDFLIVNNKIFNKDSEISKDSVNGFRLRNVIHHIKDLEDLFSNLKSYLQLGGTIEIIECSKQNFTANFFLDFLWYRVIIPRYDIWFSKGYRDYISIAKHYGFSLVEYKEEAEKEYVLLKLVKK